MTFEHAAQPRERSI